MNNNKINNNMNTINNNTNNNTNTNNIKRRTKVRTIPLSLREAKQWYNGNNDTLKRLALKVYTEEEKDINDWTIFGEPTTRTVNEEPNTVLLTCADVVNRIPDVINSVPGYVTTDKFGELNYRVKPLNEYVK